MCSCIERTEKDLRAELAKQYPDRTYLESRSSDGLQNVMLSFHKQDDSMEVSALRLFTTYVFRYTFQKKDTTTSKPKAGHMKLAFSYCPFCGEPYVQPKGKSIKVSEVYTHAISSFCRDACDMEKPVMAILGAINDFNKTAFTGVTYEGKLVYGTDVKNAISWSEFMNLRIKAPFELRVNSL